MSAGMAEVIAGHGLHSASETERARQWMCQCGQVKAVLGYGDDKPEPHASHVAEELTKAGYGLVPDVAPEYGARVMLVNGLSEEPQPQGPTPNPSWFSKSTHFRLVGPWQEIAALRDPLAAALADPEGRALVQAIHDRKAAA